MLSSPLSSPHRSSSTIECNVSLSFPLASYPLPISEGPHRPRQISPQAPPSSTINGENSPPSSSPHSLARLTLSSLSSTHRSHWRPSELSKNHATVRTLVPTTAKPLLQPRHCRPSSPVRTRTWKNIRRPLLFALMLAPPCPQPLVGRCATTGCAAMTEVVVVTARSRAPGATDCMGCYRSWARPSHPDPLGLRACRVP
jgi:hypothetical protein